MDKENYKIDEVEETLEEIVYDENKERENIDGIEDENPRTSGRRTIGEGQRERQKRTAFKILCPVLSEISHGILPSKSVEHYVY